jgi:hypothetical protein
MVSSQLLWYFWGKYLRMGINIERDSLRVKRNRIWGAEEEKLSAFPRSICPNSSLVLYAERRLFEWNFFVTKNAPL